MTGSFTRNLNPGNLILIALGHVDGDINTFFVRRQADLSRINIEFRVTAIQIEAAQGFKVTGQFLFLVFLVSRQVPPRYIITQLETVNQFSRGKLSVTDDIDLLNSRGYTFRKDEFHINTVARQWCDNGFYRRVILTDTVIEIFQPLFNV